ncbi:MAG: tRNA uridine-5-carboxymethylaminomethyl(34) synthesis GTPase MnmE [Burkholderiales bacterium]|jgi:tRNA modification GTPase|nr:tRNA uridine-5-carboxymethylaminomethyl(34) synthesis GTPase MnmE [Burkholderiales bacterium]
MRATDSEIIAAIATPPGRGGISIVRLSGRNLDAIISKISDKKALPPRHATLTRFFDSERRIIDEGIALYFVAPHSYTGEDVLELHGHGSIASSRALLARCLELGARVAEPGEFTRRAFLNDKLDLAQAEAVADLIDASTTTAARAALRSLSGAFSKEIHLLVDALTDARVHLEAALDFPEEDLNDVLDTTMFARVSSLRQTLDTLIARARAGALLREGLTVVLIGAPNVGKSSLLNFLAREEAAIVTPIAGTTRDTIERQIAIAGIPLTIVDTAGLRDTDDAVEKIGIERTWTMVERADIALLLLDARDARQTPSEENTAIMRRLPESMPRILVYNKSDLLTSEVPTISSQSVSPELETPTRSVLISVKTGDGMARLEQIILDSVHATPVTEDCFLARERHIDALNKAYGELTAAEHELNVPHPALELAAEHLRRAQDILAQITGAFSADDLLGEIFSRFCIGK